MNEILKNVKVIKIFLFLLFLNNIYYSYTGNPCEEMNKILENENICGINEKIFEEIYSYLSNNISDIINNINNTCILHKETKEIKLIMTIYTKLPDHLHFDCYENLKANCSIPSNEELMVIQTEYIKGEKRRSFYYFYNPITFDIIDPYMFEKVIVEEELYKFPKINLELALFFIEQGINLFNISDEFFTNICLNYESPNVRDIPLKIRINNLYQNVDFCYSGEFRGIDFNTGKVKCEYYFSLLDLKDNIYDNTIVVDNDTVSITNLGIIKCIKDIFDIKRFSNCFGGFMIISLFFLELICYIKFIVDRLKYIRNYLDTLTQSFIDYIGKNKSTANMHLNNPPINKRKKKISKLIY